MGLLLGNTDFQLLPKIFYGVEIWRLARPLQDLEMLLTKPLLCCPGSVFGIIVDLLERVLWGGVTMVTNELRYGGALPSKDL